MHVVSLSNKIFMVGSISWVINADRVGELIEPVQIDSASITPTPATVDPILEPPPRLPSSTTRRPLPRYQRRQINNDNLIASIDQVGLKLADCLSITESALDTLVHADHPPIQIYWRSPGKLQGLRHNLSASSTPPPLTKML